MNTNVVGPSPLLIKSRFWRASVIFHGLTAVFSRHNFCTLHLPFPQPSNPNHISHSPNPVSHSNSFIHRCNIRLTTLGRSGRVDEARKLFDEMPQPDVVSYTSMITAYIKNNDILGAENLFREMPIRNIVSYSAMIHAYAKSGNMDKARTIFDQMPQRNAYSWTSLISGYFKNGDIRQGQYMFDQMPCKNAVSWTTVLLGYAHNGLVDQARAVFDQIPHKNVVVWTAMIKSYIDNNQTDEATKLFGEMPQRNLYSWNIMIQGCLSDGRTTDAVRLFNSMPHRNEVSWTIMVTGLARNGCAKHARQYFDQIPNKDIAAWNAMITAYADQGLMAEASELFHSMLERDTVTWNAVIDGYAKCGNQGEALKHLTLMLSSCVRPNESTLISVLTSCEDWVGLSQVHALVMRLGFVHDISLTNALITTYSRCGDLGSARSAFDNFQSKDIVSWTAMILSYSNHGFGDHALQTFARMLRSGFEPDEITFLALLTACSHAGLVRKGQRFFDSMMHAYGLEPKAEHYACLVDILGRAREVDEALRVVLQMPPDKQDAAVLGALLGACKLHGEVSLANQIGRKLIDLKPTQSGGYVLLANVFAACGKWGDVAQVRKLMKGKVSSKLPGFSQIHIKGSNHVFFVGDRSHPNFNEINVMLKENLLHQMQPENLKN